MPIINYKFADGHVEEIEVSEEVASTYAQLLKYEKSVDRKGTRRQISLDKLKEKGIDLSDPNADIEVVLEHKELERQELAENKRQKASLAKKKKKLETMLTPRQAQAYFERKYLERKNVDIAARMSITEGAIRKLVKKAETNLVKLYEEIKLEREKELLLLRAIFGTGAD